MSFTLDFGNNSNQNVNQEVSQYAASSGQSYQQNYDYQNQQPNQYNQQYNQTQQYNQIQQTQQTNQHNLQPTQQYNQQQNQYYNDPNMVDQIRYATEADLDINARIAMRSADDAVHVGDVEHIKLKPNTYIGSITMNPRQAYLYRDPNIPINPEQIPPSQRNNEDPLDVPLIEQKTVNLPEGAQRLYLEILFNAVDNMEKTRREGCPLGEIMVQVYDDWVIITNGGNPMPVDYKQAMNMHVPTMMFGVPRSSDVYYKKHSSICAQNGYGAKLANIFSYDFIGEVGNADFVNEHDVRGRHFRQEWANQMSKTNPPTIVDGYTGPNFVRVAYRMKFDMFGYPHGSFYDQQAVDLFRFYAATAAFTSKVPVTFNGLRMETYDISSFSKLFFTNKQNIIRMDHEIVHCQYPVGTELKRNGDPKNPLDRPYLEIIVIDSPDSAQVISFVNSMPAFNGGTHVNAVYQSVGASFLKEINESKTATTKNIKLNITNLKNHLTVIVNYRVGQLDFDSQSKTKYDGKAPKVEIPEKLLARIKHWDLMARLQADLRAKCFKSEPVGKKKKYLFDGKSEDANYAGTKRWEECR